MKKLVSLFLIAVFALSIAGCGKKEESADLGKITMWTWLGGEELWGGKTKDVMCMQEFAKRMNVELDIQNPSGESGEAFNLMMTKGEKLPDMIFYSWSVKRQLDYSKNKRVVDIAPYIQSEMPHLYKMMQANPRLKAQMTSEDGCVYYLPWISEGKIYYEGMMMRKDWLAAVNKSVPKTNEELYQTLKAMKIAADAGKLPAINGKKFYGLSGYYQQMYKLLYGFGACQDFQIDTDGKTIVYGPVSDKYRDGIKFLNKMYKEGLMDPDLLSGDGELYKKHHLANQTACYIDGYGSFQQIEMDSKKEGSAIEYVGVPYPVTNGYNVAMEYNSTAKRVAQPYGFALTVKNVDRLKKILKIMDYKYGEEGRVLFNWGVDGKTFTKGSDGKYAYTDLIMKDPKFPPATAMSKYVKPDFTAEDIDTVFALVDERGKQTMKLWANTDTKFAYEPTLWYTADEMAAIGKHSADITTYVTEMAAKFVSGKADPNDDKVWKDYIDRLNAMEFSERLKIEQAAFDRFNKRSK